MESEETLGHVMKGQNIYFLVVFIKVSKPFLKN